MVFVQCFEVVGGRAPFVDAINRDFQCVELK